MRIDELVLELRRCWAKSGIPENAGATDAQLDEFRRVHQVQLPEDFERLYRCVDGTDGEMDELLVEFLSLARISTVRDAVGDFRGVPDYGPIVDTLPHFEEYFVFADFLITSHVYAIRLRPSPAEGDRISEFSRSEMATDCSDGPNTSTEVLLICGREFEKVADSFTEFLDRYLNAPRSLQL